MQIAARAVWRSIAPNSLMICCNGSSEMLRRCRTQIMLLVVINEAQSLDFCCSLAYPRVSSRAARFSDRRRRGRCASGSKRWQGEGCTTILELSRASSRLSLLRLRSKSRRGDNGRFAYRCWTLTAAVNFVGLDAAAAQFERGQRERPDPELLLRARAAEGRPRVVSATCWSTATSLPAAYASQARRTQA